MSRTAGFDEWYETTRPLLVRSLVVACAGDVDAATDAVDEAMVRALERWPRVRAMANPEGWVFRVATNHVRRRWRRRSTEARATDRLVAGANRSAGSDPTDAVAVWTAVADLDRRSREVVALRYVVGLTEPEIATLLGIRPGTVSSLLSRARNRLRGRLAPEERP